MKKRVLSVLLALVLLLSLLPTGAIQGTVHAAETVAYAVEGGNIYFDPATGAITDCDTTVTSAVIPEKINGIAVTTIGEWAFYSCESLTSVIIPNSVTSVCNYAFCWCTGLTNVTIPDSVTIIGSYAFSYCDSLTSVMIHNGVTSIGDGAFSDCDSLIGIWVDSKNPAYSSDDYCVLFNKDKTQLIQYPGGRQGSYSIPNSVTTIGADAFLSCDSLTSVTIPNSVTTIGNDAFSWCSGLISVTIPNSVTSIGKSAFSWCSGLTSVTIPNGVITIGSNAFSNCYSLTSIWVAPKNPAYSSDDYGVLFNKDKTQLIQYPGGRQGSYSIPNSVPSIDDHTFAGCDSLTGVTISDGVISIGKCAFADCFSLTSVTIPNSVTSIGYWAFSDCDSLTSVTVLNANCSIYDIEDTLGVAGTTVIYGYPGSTAEAYAKKYGYAFSVLEGDAPGGAVLTGSVTEEMTHLIFADMAYAHIPASYKGKTVAQWLKAVPWLTATSEYTPKEMDQPIYQSSTVNRKDVYGLLGDWTIASVETGKSGYAAVVFQKGTRIIIAYRGSEEGFQTVFEGKDWTIDMQFALFNYLNPDQFGAALDTYTKYEGKGNVTLTGHSLGGALTTYVSTIKNVKGYAFDGACGHVVDLTYLEGALSIDFTDTAAIPFTNYTDPASSSYLIADLIQHTNENLFPGVCYKTNGECISYYGAGTMTHQQYSNTQLTEDQKSIEFMPLAETHTPKNGWYASVDYELTKMIPGDVGNIVQGLFSQSLLSEIGRLAKVGNVILGTGAEDTLSVLGIIDDPGDITALITKNVLYGGTGKDTINGSAGADILVPNGADGDVLNGKLGNDCYVIDCKKGGSVYISDQSGSDWIYLKNAGDLTLSSVKYTQKSQDGKWHIYSVNGNVYLYIKSTLFKHQFAVSNEYGEKICSIDTKGSAPTKSVALREPDSEMDYKEFYIEGDVTVRIYDENDNLVGTYNLQKSGLYTEDFGTVEVGKRGGTSYLSATVAETYRAEVEGKSSADISLISTDAEGYVDRTTLSQGLDLSVGEAYILPEEQIILQNGISAVTTEEVKTTKVELSKDTLTVKAGSTGSLTAKAFFPNGTSTGNIYWLSSDSSVAECKYDENGGCTVTGISTGEATIYAIARDSGITAECKLKVVTDNPFKDVQESDYYYIPVLWAVDNGITNGTSATKFSPDKACTRGQIVTFLWRAAGSPQPTTTENPFSDIQEKDYFYKAVLWAVENGITTGTGKGKFSPDKECTRAQVATFLWRAQGEPTPTTAENTFSDVAEGTYYYDAVLWAVEQGITNGTGKGKFSPDNSCTRGQIVTFLYRALG